MPEVDRPDYVMYEMVLEEAKKKNKKPRPNSANTALNLENIKMKLQVFVLIFLLNKSMITIELYISYQHRLSSSLFVNKILKIHILACLLPKKLGENCGAFIYGHPVYFW